LPRRHFVQPNQCLPKFATKAIRLTIPESLLLRAYEVIE
jgi:hypothetical protein